MIAGIKPEDVKVLREETDWLAQQLQRLEQVLFHLNRKSALRPVAQESPR